MTEWIYRHMKWIGLPLAVVLILVLGVAPAAAKEITISPGTSLSMTIASADPGDIIILNPGTYSENGITVRKNITIAADTKHGHGPSDTIIDGKSASPRIFTVPGSDFLTIDNLTIRNGRAKNGDMGSAGYNGGAIESHGPVLIISSTITGCLAGNGGDGGTQYAGGKGGKGGAISSAGPVTLISTVISSCKSGKGGDSTYMAGDGGAGGALWSDDLVTVTSSTITGCSTGDGETGSNGGAGGAIASSEDVIVTSSTISGCFTGNGGTRGKDSMGGSGGAIFSGESVTLISSIISDCRTGDGGGSGGNSGRGGAIMSWGSVTVDSSTITNCSTGKGGPGGSGGKGGAIWVYMGLAATSSTFTNCSAGTGGAGGTDGIGGAIFNSDVRILIGSHETATIRSCRIEYNSLPEIAGPIDATGNWWGTNNVPAGFVGAGATADPWLVLGLTADPAAITVGQNSRIRASLTSDSNGNDTSQSGIVPDGIPTSFTTNSYPSDIFPTVTGFKGGSAVTVFSPKSAGTANVTVSVGDQTMSTSVTATMS